MQILTSTLNPQVPSPPAQPQGTSVSRLALARWLSGYRIREQCAQNRHSVAALIRDLRAANPAWTPDEVHKAAQAFFEALALDRQETRHSSAGATPAGSAGFSRQPSEVRCIPPLSGVISAWECHSPSPSPSPKEGEQQTPALVNPRAAGWAD